MVRSKAAAPASDAGAIPTGTAGHQEVLLLPEDLHVADNPEHPLYDHQYFEYLERFKGASDPMVANVAQHGVKTAVAARVERFKDADGNDQSKLVVVFGRKRRLWTETANTSLKGTARKRIPVVVYETLSDKEAADMMRIENAVRVEEPAWAKAAKLGTYLATHGSDKETRTRAASTFGVSDSTIRAWAKFDKASPKLKEAVKSGFCTFVAALEIASSYKTHDEQEAALKEALKAAKKSEAKGAKGKKSKAVSSKAHAKAKKGAKGGDDGDEAKIKAPKADRIKAFADSLDGGDHEETKMALYWAAGELSDEDAAEQVSGFFEFLNPDPTAGEGDEGDGEETEEEGGDAD